MSNVGVEVRQTNYDRILGKAGWQFISKIDFIDEKNAGQIPLTEAELAQWARTLEARQTFCAELGATYRIMVAPNKATVYGEYLPEALRPVDERPLPRLRAYLSRHASVKLLDPSVALLQEKLKRDVYFRGDEHWNPLGAFIAYRLLMQEVAKTVKVPILEEHDLEVSTRPFVGGLEALADAPTPEYFQRLKVKKETGKEVFVNKPKGRGKVQVFESADQSLPRAILFRDSFGSFMLPYIVESFSRVVVLSSRFLLRDLVKFERPQVVLHEICERYLHPVADDALAKSFEESCNVTFAELAARN